MDVQRAKEIAGDPDMLNVTYNDVPIYIENVNEHSGTAKVHTIHSPEYEYEVPVQNLKEE